MAGQSSHSREAFLDASSRNGHLIVWPCEWQVVVPIMNGSWRGCARGSSLDPGRGRSVWYRFVQVERQLFLRPCRFLHSSCRLRFGRKAVVFQDVFMEVFHGLPLSVQTLSGCFTERQGFFQDAFVELRPHIALGRIALWSVGKDWLHFLLREDFPRALRL